LFRRFIVIPSTSLYRRRRYAAPASRPPSLARGRTVPALLGFASPPRSFPLNRRRRLARDVVNDAIDATHFVRDPVAYPRQELCRQRRPMRCHEVSRLHRAKRDGVLVRAAVAHHADRAHRQKYRERLRRLVVPRLTVGIARRTQLIDEHGVSA